MIVAFARTCSTRLMPTSAVHVAIPGVERTNWIARFRIRFHSESVRDKWRQATRELALQHRGAGDERNAQFGRSSDDRPPGAVDGLIDARQCFRHPQVARQLHEAKMVRAVGSISCANDSIASS